MAVLIIKDKYRCFGFIGNYANQYISLVKSLLICTFGKYSSPVGRDCRIKGISGSWVAGSSSVRGLNIIFESFERE